jgi:hypothetical protein
MKVPIVGPMLCGLASANGSTVDRASIVAVAMIAYQLLAAMMRPHRVGEKWNRDKRAVMTSGTASNAARTGQ